MFLGGEVPMNRIKFVQDYVNSIFDNIIEPTERRAAYIHSYGVAQSCAFLAQQKGLDVEIATATGLLHDIYFYKTGVYSLHAHNGAEMVRVALKNQLNNLFSDERQIMIESAIYHHTDKEHRHDEYDELLKDCDTLQHYLFDVSAERYISKRLVQVAAQFNITLLESI